MDFEQELDRVSIACNGSTLLRLIATPMRRTTDWSERQIEQALYANCTITKSPEGPVIQGRYPRILR